MLGAGYIGFWILEVLVRLSQLQSPANRTMETAKSALKYAETLQLSTEAKEQALKETTWAHVRLSYEKRDGGD